jgi:hypothetical protein
MSGKALAVLGFAIQVLSLVTNLNPFDSSGRVLSAIVLLFGTVVLLVGCAFYLEEKGRHPAFCLLALFSIPGFYVLALLKDKPVKDKRP